MTKSRGINRPHHRWTAAELKQLRRDYPDTVTKDLAARLGLRVEVVYAAATRLGLRKSEAFHASSKSGRILRGGRLSVTTQFKPGHVPANKGLRRPGWAPGRMAETQFKAGQRGNKWVPVGTLRVNSDGYLDRKVADSGYLPRDWTAVHRLVWAEANGPIPHGHVVVFRPGRRTTDVELITLDALELITRRELMARNTVQNLPPELRQVIQLRGAVVRQINKRAKS